LFINVILTGDYSCKKKVIFTPSDLTIPFFFLFSLIKMLSLNEQVVQFVYGLAYYRINLPFVDYGIPVSMTLLCTMINHSYRSSLGVTHAQIGWYQGLLATLVMAIGGGFTASVLQGEPLPFLKSNEFWAIHW
jgi:hypothetical protein